MNEFIIGNCPNLESLEGLKNAGIQLLRLGKCPNFKNTDSLSEFELLQCCDFSDSALLESVQALANLPPDRPFDFRQMWKGETKATFS